MFSFGTQVQLNLRNKFCDIFSVFVFVRQLKVKRLIRKLLLILTLLTLVGSWLVWSFGASALNPRPDTLGLELRGHDSVPSLRRLEWNGTFPARYRTTDLTDLGGIFYKSDWDNTLEFKLHWVELQTNRAYQIAFDVDALDLSNFGEAKEHATLRIDIGAGGDVQVSTGNPEALRLTGLRQFDEISDDMILDRVVLLELCAAEIPNSNPVVADMVENGMDPTAIRGAEIRYQRWISSNLPISSKWNQ